MDSRHLLAKNNVLSFLPHAHTPFHGIHILILTYNLIQIVIEIIVKRLFAVHPNFLNLTDLPAVIVIPDFWQFFNLFKISVSVVRYIEFFMALFFLSFLSLVFFAFYMFFCISQCLISHIYSIPNFTYFLIFFAWFTVNDVVAF